MELQEKDIELPEGKSIENMVVTSVRSDKYLQYFTSVDDRRFLKYLSETLCKDGFSNDYEIEEIISSINELGYLDGDCSLKKDSPKVIQSKEIFEPKILKKMKEYFVESDEDLTKRNVRSYISRYNKFCYISGDPLSYFFTNDEKDNLLIEWFENDLGEILLRRDIVNDGGQELYFVYMDVLFLFIDEFCREMVSSDIKTITKKLIQTL